MTRVNAGLDPRTLHRAHLIAEIREITMVPASLRRSLRTKHTRKILSEIPKQFTLNSGHVKFFYDKLSFLQNRFHSLANEMIRRGYAPDESRVVAFDGFPPEFYNDWAATEYDNDIVRARIALRISEKPHLYKDKLD